MEVIPEFWRMEIWHPLSVHLPVAALIIATVLLIVAKIIKRNSWKEVSYVLLILGTLGAWLAVYTGHLADDTISREICDPTILETHEFNSYIVAWLFTAASVLAIADMAGFLRKLQKWVFGAIVALMLVGSGFLVYSGHLGAKLVYQQAAGVYQPSENCEEFE